MSIKDRSDQLIRLFKAALGILYIVMGIVIFYIKNNPVFSNYSETVKITFSVMLIAYGAFRLYRVFTIDKIEDEEE
ncbi:MAG: hypothetical protein ACOYOA_09215 [Saprospiraceae bacterium]